MPNHRFFLVILLLILPTQLGLHTWPDWAMVLGRRIDYLSPTLYVTDLFVLLTIGTWFLGTIVKTRNKKLNTKNNYKRIVLFIFLTTFIFLNIMNAASREVAFYKWIKVIEYTLLGWYIVKTKPSFTSIVFPLTVSLFYSSIIAIIQFYLQHSIGGLFWFLGERTFTMNTPGIALMESCSWKDIGSCGLILRPYATFPHPNVLGGFLAVTLPLLFHQIIEPMSSTTGKRNGAMYYWFTIVSFVLGGVALILTFSRSAWIVAILATLWVWVRTSKEKKHNCLSNVIPGFPLHFLLALGIAAISIYIVQSFQTREESVVVRTQLNNTSVALWKQSPIIGVGLGNFLVMLPEVLPTRSIYFLQPVHNIYLLILVETGAVGFLLFLLILWLVFRKYVTRDSRNQTQGYIRIPYHMSLAALLLLGLVDHYPLALQQGQLLLTLLIALSW